MKKGIKNVTTYLPYLLIIFFLLILITPFYFAKADPSSTDASISAILYDTSSYASGTTLTQAGASVNGWAVDTNKYLQIDPEVPNDGNTYKVVIELSQEFYAAIQSISTPSGYSNVDFTKNSAITINTNKKYELKQYSGKFEYTMEAKQTKGTIQLAISYDDVLWGNIANARLTPEGIKPITVKLLKGAETVKEISISSATAGAARGYSRSIYVNGVSGSCSIKPTESVPIRPTYAASNQSTYYYYYPKLTMNIKLPSYKDSNDVIHYIDMDISNFAFDFISTGTAEYTVDSSDIANGNVTMTFNNIYMKTGYILTFTTKFPSNMTAEPSSEYLFKGGNIKFIAESKNGISTDTFYNVNIHSITFTTVTEEKVAINAFKSYVTIDNRPSTAVGRIAGLGLVNTGKGDSSSKNLKYEFDIENTNRVKVTTINVPGDKNQEYINIKYTMVDDEGNKIYFDSNGNVVQEGTEGAQDYWIYSQKNGYYKSKATKNLYTRLHRNQLILTHKNYYFKSIEYTLQTIEAGMQLYNSSGSSSIASSGNFFGYINEGVTSGQKAIHKLTVTSEGINTISKTVETEMSMKNNPAFYISAQNLSKSSIEAGESLDLSGTVTIVEYPYGYATWLKNVVIAIELPSGVTINERTLNIKDGTGTKITGYTFLAPQDVGDGKYLWKIKLPDDVSIGKYSETLGNMTTGGSISFSMTLETSLSMNTTLLELKNMIYVSGINQTNSSGGSYNFAIKRDKYDINENGGTDDYVTGVRENNTVTCQITPKSATLDLDNSISIKSNGNILSSGDNNLYTKDDILTYTVHIGCTSGGQVDNFQYYIPIPKSVAKKDDFIINKNNFEFALQSEATMTGNDIFNLQYTSDTGLEYETAKSVTNWYLAEDIENDNTLNWSDITMIKITMKNGIIENGNSCDISVDMKYGGNTYKEQAGMINEWASGGEYNYYNNGRIASGNMATTPISVMLNCEINLADITLTAAKDRILVGDAANQVTVNSGLPQFVNSQTFTIQKLETYNVELKTKNYMQSNLDMASVDANQYFAITIKLNNNSEYDLIKDTKIGNNNSNTIPNLTYELYNANALSDNLQTRYVSVTLKSNNGVVIKQKVNINRQLAVASEVQPAIVAGRNFSPSSDTTITVTITEDSSFTAQFAAEYLPSLYSSQKIMLSENIPKDARIILVDMRENQAPTYWYYITNGLEGLEIDLSSFKQIGTTSGCNYSKSNNSGNENEQFILAVDFSNCKTFIERGTHTINLKFEGDEVDDFTFTSLDFITTAKREFSMNLSTTNTMFDSDFAVNYNLSSILGVETKYLGKKLALIITAPSDLPLDSNIIINSNKYYMNSNREFIIPMDEIQTGNKSVIMKLSSDTIPKTANTYTLNIALWVSATANGTKPKLGEKLDNKDITVSSKNILQPALKVNSIENRLINTDELKNTNSVNIDYKKIEECKLTLELQKKVGNGYQKVTNSLVEVDGVTSHTMGVFDLNIQNGNNNLNFVLSIATEKGTYRLVFKVQDSLENTLIEVPYNFIVIE